jgi:hypothetical protein
MIESGCRLHLLSPPEQRIEEIYRALDRGATSCRIDSKRRDSRRDDQAEFSHQDTR